MWRYDPIRLQLSNAIMPADQNEVPRVFISYTGRDRTRVMPFVRALEKEGLSSWMDVQNLKPGQEWLMELQRALTTAPAVLYFVGSGNTGLWARQEYQIAVRMRVHAQTLVIPVLLDEEASTAKLNDELAMLGNYQWVNGWETDAVARVAQALRSAQTGETSQ